jgi:nucleoside-diphosphate-sugar epimerase
MTPLADPTAPGPLILGASGRVGQALRRVAASGHWPGPAPLWHARSRPADLCFDLLQDSPALPPARGVVILAGVTAGDDVALARNTDLAQAGIALARRHDLGPVLVMSSGGVYGPARDPRREDSPLHPGTAYARAKRAMELALADAGVTCLRLANVAGCDALFAAAARGPHHGPVRLDRFADGTGPTRAYIGPVTLARVLTGLLAHALAGGTLPAILNVASPNPLAMADVLAAAGLPFDWTPAPATALHRLVLDTTALARVVALPPVTPAALVAEARAGGWTTAP